MQLISRNEAETATIGTRLASCLAPGDVIALSGPLGAGKSVLARAVLRSLTCDPELAVPSPSFTLVQIYETPQGMPLWHVDLYRLASSEELVEIGLDEAFETAITLIEWPERAEGILPDTRLTIHIARCGEGERSLDFEGEVGWRSRLTPLTGMEA